MRLSLVLLPLLLAACSIEPVRRTIDLAPHVDLPSGLVDLRPDGALRVELGEIEPLNPSHAYVAWASTVKDSIYLGTLSAEAPLDVLVTDLGIEAADIDQLRVTIEERSSLPRASPSAPPVLEAAVTALVPSSLTIPRTTEEELAGAMATAIIENSRVEVSSMGLPLLPSALFHGVWLDLDAAADAGAPAAEPPGGHTHATGSGHDEASADPGVRTVFVGGLDPTGALKVDLGFFAANARSMRICVEADHGIDARSPSCVLHGEVVLTAGASEPSVAEHVH